MDFKNYGLKSTKIRQNIFKILKDSKTPLTAEDIYKIYSCEEVNLSTIYRTLTTFYTKNIVTKEMRNDGKSAYHLNQETHQHILICSKCNKIIYLNKCPFETMKQEVLKETGFLLQNHNIELHGICINCQKR